MSSSGEEIFNTRLDDADISLQSDFCLFVCESNMYLLDLKDTKIQYRVIANIEECVKYAEHMKHIHKSIFGSPRKDPHPLKRDFADTIHYFQNTQPKKKLFCRNKDYYLVKKSFTEGVQHVQQGEMHIYKAITRPLDIYISDRPLEPNTIRSNYDAYTISERISPGEAKIIPPNTYYVVIAPCHAYFKKAIVEFPTPGGCTEISHSVSTEVELLDTSVEEDRELLISSGRPNQEEVSPMQYRMSFLSQSARSKDDEHGNSRHSMELERINESEMVNDSGYRAGRTFERDQQLKRVKSTTPLTKASSSQVEIALAPPLQNSLRDDMGLISNLQAINGTSIGNQRRTVFAIRKAGNINSYTLRSDSTFRVFLNMTTGSFAIVNDDMDPNVIEYHGEGKFIREIAKFKNGSTFENKLAVRQSLLDELQDPIKKREEVVVDYFFEFAFRSIEATYKTIETTYKKFSDMRNVKMIGSCVPAIVPLNDAIFRGVVSDSYETKP